MTVSRKLTSLTLAAAVAAGGLMPLASTANAGPRHHKYGYGSNYGYSQPYYGNSGRHHNGYYRKKKRNNAGKAIAIGAGLLMLGIIASEASRPKHRYRYR